ncbi:MAG TPA: PIN domain-containing protein, partial [Pseudonocardiaceae bacterium]|nr:PIN domain-containing protein [Pseudonocardiaceae bacterium]
MLLADTSAWHRSGHPAVTEEWSRLLDRDEIATSAPVRLEVLYSARSAKHYAELSEELDSLHQLPCGEPAMDRALWVQRQLAEKHALHHRSVKIPDLLIAAAAELGGATLWHYDEDYDR